MQVPPPAQGAWGRWRGTTLIGAPFLGTYLGQARRSLAYGLPAAVVAGATLAHVWRPGIGQAAAYPRQPYSL